jgi:ribosomal protein S18 acetylase RimI-like enzyme
MKNHTLQTQFSPYQQATIAGYLHQVDDSKLIVQELGVEDEAEVLNFLAQRPSHTFGLSGFIRANGIVNPLNRGIFYAYRNNAGQLEGVALIGHHILFDTRNDVAIKAFAETAQHCKEAFVLLAERDKAQTFWDYYAEGGKSLHVLCREMLMEQRWPVQVRQPVAGLRQATLEELDLVAPAHAEIAFAESGINPLEKDPEGFRARCTRRIENGKTWVWVEDGRLIFKADIISDTPDVIYVEGVWVNPQERNKGYGLRCMSQLMQELLPRTKAVCLLANENFKGAEAFYKRAGFKAISQYDTVYLKEK